MSKWYEVEITAHKVVVVEMPDGATEAEAFDFAISESGLQENMVESEIRELKSEMEIDCARRHADQVEPL
jgi:hypothetical protein